MIKSFLIASLAFFPWAAEAQGASADWEWLARRAVQAGLSKPNLGDLTQPQAVADATPIALRGFISLWSQDCAPACGLPSPLLKNDPVNLSLDLPGKPGEFRTARVKRDYRAGDLAVQVQAAFYALCPNGAAGGACSSRYFNVQVELSGAVSALCSASINEADFSPFPVLACGAAQGRKRLGVTLHRAQN